MGQFIPNFEYFWPPAQGLTGWTVAFYGAGLDPIPANLKTVYADQAQTTPIANPVELDVEGKCSVVLGAGGYKVVVRDDEGVIQDTKDNVSNSAGGGPGSETAFVENIEALRNWTTFSGSVYVAGYYAASDGGEGTFYWAGDDSNPDDGGYTIAPASSPLTGRWVRVPDEAQVVRSASFGAIGTSSNRTAQMVNADQYAAANDLQLLVNVPVTVGTISFTAPLVKVSEGAFLRGPSGTSTYTFQGIFEAEYSYVFDNSVGTVNVVFSSRQVSNPYWFGGSPSAEGSTNASAFVRWLAAGGGFMVLPPGSWKHTGSFTPSASIPTRYDGKITLPNPPYSVTTNTGAYYPDLESKLHIGLVEFPNNQLLYQDGAYGIGTTGGFLVEGVGRVNGKSFGKAGIGTEYFRVGGSFWQFGPYFEEHSFNDSTPICSKVIPANTLSQNGDRLRIIVQGTYYGDWSSAYGALNPKIPLVAGTLFGGGPLIYLIGQGFGSYRGEFDLVRVSDTTAIAYPISYDTGAYVASDFNTQIWGGGVVTLTGSGWAQNQTFTVEGYRGGGAPPVGNGYLNYVDIQFVPKNS